MNATDSRSFFALLAVTLLLPTALAALVNGVPAASARPAHVVAAASSDNAKLRRQLRRVEKHGWPFKPAVVDPAAAARCDEPGTHEEAVLLPNARLFYRNWRGEEPEDDANANRATGCFYETGRRTEFGFANVIEGESFSITKGAGDFVALSASQWEAADGSEDRFQLWNMRTGELNFNDPSCATVTDDCYIADIALTANGSLAYSACLSSACHIYVKQAGDIKRSVTAIVKNSHGTALLARAGRLYWLNSHGRLRSRSFL